jgi:hypothetical protein
MLEITLTASLVYEIPRARFSPSVFAKALSLALAPAYGRVLSVMDFAASLEAF